MGKLDVKQIPTESAMGYSASTSALDSGTWKFSMEAKGKALKKMDWQQQWSIQFSELLEY